jgi:DNA-binding LacI/PurR family transcriptional regulator
MGQKEKRRRVTSADVAREAGVSRATVSYVLNNVQNKSISAATRALVLDTARQLGHVPHASARALRLGRTNVVLALVRDFTFGYVADHVLEVLDVELTKRGFVFFVHRYSEPVRPLAELLPLVDPQVVVSMGGLSAPETPPDVPGFTGRLISAHTVVNHRRAGEMQAEHLFRRGHRHIGYAYPADPGVQLIADERLRGTRAACKRLGLDPPVMVVLDRNDITSAERALDTWEESLPRTTGVCAHNDEHAIMLMLTMSRRGQEVGRDIAIMGIDDIPLAGVGITTVGFDIQRYSARILEHVLAALEERPPTIDRKPVFRLIVRSSA